MCTVLRGGEIPQAPGRGRGRSVEGYRTEDPRGKENGEGSGGGGGSRPDQMKPTFEGSEGNLRTPAMGN